MQLYDVGMSPNAKKVRVIARELGIPLDKIPVDLQRGDAAYRELNPTGKVPTLDDDGYVLWESGAILAYLATREESALLPRDARGEADVLRWMFFGATHIQPWMSLLGQERLIKPMRGIESNPTLIAHAERELQRFIPVIDRALAGSEYLTPTFSVADIFVGCGFDACEKRGVDCTPYRALSDWRERLAARPSWAD
jgi:glutathione S-transferase